MNTNQTSSHRQVTPCLFVSDLHGSAHRYETLVRLIREELPAVVFLGGDLFPSYLLPSEDGLDEKAPFIERVLMDPLIELKRDSTLSLPRLLMILGNDDPRTNEETLRKGEREGVWEYIHGRSVQVGAHTIFGYNYVPPTPFRLKDWERYDVSRFVDPGCVSPEEGIRSVQIPDNEARYRTIAKDLEEMTEGCAYGTAVLLSHSPPYGTELDTAALHGRFIDHVPLDPHIGSVAIRKFLEQHQPLLSLHGHVHESSRLTGVWKECIGSTVCLSAAWDGPELAVVRFDLGAPMEATRELLAHQAEASGPRP